MRRRKPKLLRAVRPNAGLIARYRRRLDEIIGRMADGVERSILAAWRADPPLASDALPTAGLQSRIDEMRRKWMADFDALAEKLADYFATAVKDRSDATLKSALADSGLAVEFKMTRAMRDVFRATVQANVALIKSIPQRYLAEVEGSVMRAAQAGRDEAQLYRDLRQHRGVTKRRAALISRDQMNKATSALTSTRQQEIGITHGVWRHSHAGKTPRPTHVRMDGKKFKLDKGLYDSDEGEYVMPSQLVNCFPASTEIQFADGVEVAYRRFYAGKLTEIVTSSGKTLRGTPNHPVLTPNGWRPLGLLNEGDDVIELGDDALRKLMVEPDVNQAVPAIIQVFRSVLDSCGRKKIALGGKFHGDQTDGNVDVIFADRPLSFGIKPRKGGESFGFREAHNTTLGHRLITHLLVGSFRTASGDVGFLSERRPTFASLSLHPEVVSFATSSRNTPGVPYSFSDERSGNTVRLSQSEERDTVNFVFPTQLGSVVDKKKIAFVGHVFNLQTKSGLYVADGLVVHNCRCFWTPVLPGLGE